MKAKILFMSLVLTLQSTLVKPPVLVNPGNFCYLNTAIQLLYAIKPLTLFLIDHNNNYTKNSLGYYYAELTKKIYENTYNQADVNKFIQFYFKTIEKKTINISEKEETIADLANAQGDTVEFLGNIINHLIDDINVEYQEYITNLLTVKDELIEPNYNYLLGFPFSIQNTDSIKDIILNNTALTNTPKTLLIPINRTDSQEIHDKDIETPLELTIQGTKYELVGVLIHLSPNYLTGGHYVVFVKDIKDKNWYFVNDMELAEIQGEKLTPDELKNGLILPELTIKKERGSLFVYVEKKLYEQAPKKQTPKKVITETKKSFAPTNQPTLTQALENLTDNLYILQAALENK